MAEAAAAHSGESLQDVGDCIVAGIWQLHTDGQCVLTDRSQTHGWNTHRARYQRFPMERRAPDTFCQGAFAVARPDMPSAGEDRA